MQIIFSVSKLRQNCVGNAALLPTLQLCARSEGGDVPGARALFLREPMFSIAKINFAEANMVRIVVYLVMMMCWASGDVGAESNNAMPGIREGVGVGSIVVKKSSRADVVALYGGNYQLVEHNGYSDELIYKDIGISFFYCHALNSQTIFAIKMARPYLGATSRGIVVGKNTLQDVLNLYGSASLIYTSEEKLFYGFEYLGISFKTDFVEGVDEAVVMAKLKNKKIIAIDVFDPEEKGNACDEAAIADEEAAE